MSRQQRDWTWPFLVVLTCLFVLSALAPRTWQRFARQQTAEEMLAEAAARPADARAAEPARRVEEPVADATVAPVVATAPALPTEPPAPSDAWAVAEASEKLADRPVDGPDLPLLAPRQEHEEKEAWEDPPRDETSEGQEGEDDAPEAFEHVAHLPAPIEHVPNPMDPPVPLESSPADESTVDEGAAGKGVAEARSSWPRPETLLAQLAQLAAEPETAPWASQVGGEIEKLDKVVAVDAGEVGRICDRLGEMAREGDRLARQLGLRPSASRVRRATYALRRRLDIWRETLAVAGAIAAVPEPDSKQLAMALAKVDAAMDGQAQGRAWREYLLLDALGEVSEPTG
ncbi:MAG: hypothetical protein NTW96_02180, partial [Planctomycetia bacterium]|nr:hypothetical protein [Planctomycetia bacterium]